MQVQVLAIKRMSGVGKASGKPYSMDIATVVVAGEESIAAGELVLPSTHTCEAGGKYDAVFAPVMYKGRIEFQIARFIKVK